MKSNENQAGIASDVMTAEAYRAEKYACDAWIDAAATMLCRYCEQIIDDAEDICDACFDDIMQQVSYPQERSRINAGKMQEAWLCSLCHVPMHGEEID